MSRLLLLLLFPIMVHAYTPEVQMVCSGIRWVAEDVMKRRMSLEPMERVMRDMMEQSTANNRARGIEMVQKAYSVPPVHGEAQRMIIDGFADLYYVDCLNAVSGIK